jgi:hypothetical protein
MAISSCPRHQHDNLHALQRVVQEIEVEKVECLEVKKKKKKGIRGPGEMEPILEYIT